MLIVRNLESIVFEKKGQGSYRQDYVKFRTFQGLLKDFPTVFKD